MRFDDTIAAISTPPGEGGVAMVRLSGPQALAISGQVFRRRRRGEATLLPWHVYLGDFLDLEGKIIDECLCTYFAAPKSFTAEDVVEFSLHGGGFLAGRALEVLVNSGARLAGPGEFTRRAFVNGRLSLSQAEAVIDVIRADSDVALRQANDHLRGRLSDFVRRQRESCLEALALIEASVDFPEDDLPRTSASALSSLLTNTGSEISTMLATVRSGRATVEGLRAVLVGRPNAGKSSLLNALIGEERAIVTEIAGTTRDTIEARLNLDGMLITLWDTAGLREGQDLVEKLGVERTERAIEAADLVLLLIDGAGALHSDDEKLLARTEGLRRIVLTTKADLPRRLALQPYDALAVSVVSHEGLTDLRVRLAREARSVIGPENALVITNLRHSEALGVAFGALQSALGALQSGWELELAAIDIREAFAALGSIIGEHVDDSIADAIFSRFCIGK